MARFKLRSFLWFIVLTTFYSAVLNYFGTNEERFLISLFILCLGTVIALSLLKKYVSERRVVFLFSPTLTAFVVSSLWPAYKVGILGFIMAVIVAALALLFFIAYLVSKIGDLD